MAADLTCFPLLYCSRAVIILSKVDLIADEEMLKKAKAILQDLNPMARFVLSRNGDLPLSRLGR